MRHNRQGLTLLETLLAITLSVTILLPLMMSLRIGVKSWKENTRTSELLQHARVAMHRITSELRYATEVLQAESTTHSYLRFTTAYTEDDDADLETIEFYRLNGNPVLYRRISHPIGHPVAGIVFDDIAVDAFEITPMKVVGGNNLVALGGSDTIDMTEAVDLELTMKNVVSGKTVTVSSLATLRNR